MPGSARQLRLRPAAVAQRSLQGGEAVAAERGACKMGLEGILSKRKTSTYRSGRSPDWLKSKNPACEVVRREAEEDRASGGIHINYCLPLAFRATGRVLAVCHQK
jgi:ATP-dependent DNA ligase